MPELPASVRVALWVSHSWALGHDPEGSIAHALPDVDIVLGLSEQVRLWGDLGERSLFAALPRPGARGLLPSCPDECLDLASSVGEAVFVPGVGGVSVPRHVAFGADAPGLALRWETFDAAPVPVHRLAAVDVPGADLDLRRAVHAAADALGDGGWADAWQRERADRVERRWGLPSELPERVRGLVVRAGAILEVCDAGLEHADGSATAELAASRRAPLLALRAVATAALETATCAGVSYLSAHSRTMRS